MMQTSCYCVLASHHLIGVLLPFGQYLTRIGGVFLKNRSQDLTHESRASTIRGGRLGNGLSALGFVIATLNPRVE